MKIPKEAKKVFSGVIFDAFQWEQRLFDGSTATFEMLKRPNTLLSIPTIDDTIIIGKQEQPGLKPIYGFLGGRQNTDETPEEGAKRELLEEGGITSNEWKLYKTFEPHSKLEWTIYYFIARNCSIAQKQILDAGEKITITKVNFDELIDMVLGEEFYGTQFALHIAKLKIRNRLDELRTLLFKK